MLKHIAVAAAFLAFSLYMFWIGSMYGQVAAMEYVRCLDRGALPKACEAILRFW